jgi:hypothetical protein
MLSEAQLELSAFADHEIRRVGATVSAIGVANPVVSWKRSVFEEKVKPLARPPHTSKSVESALRCTEQ